MTIDLDNNELSHIYGICADAVNVSDYGGAIRNIIEDWMRIWYKIYRKNDRYSLVFYQGDIPILYSILEYADREYRSAGMLDIDYSRKQIVKTLLNFIMRHEKEGCES
jgi:hypothetical protein